LYKKARNFARKVGFPIVLYYIDLWAFVSKIERGIKYPTSDTLSAIANGLGVEVYELFRHDHSPAQQRILFERFKVDITQNVMKTLETVYKAYEE